MTKNQTWNYSIDLKQLISDVVIVFEERFSRLLGLGIGDLVFKRLQNKKVQFWYLVEYC